MKQNKSPLTLRESEGIVPMPLSNWKIERRWENTNVRWGEGVDFQLCQLNVKKTESVSLSRFMSIGSSVLFIWQKKKMAAVLVYLSDN